MPVEEQVIVDLRRCERLHRQSPSTRSAPLKSSFSPEVRSKHAGHPDGDLATQGDLVVETARTQGVLDAFPKPSRRQKREQMASLKDLRTRIDRQIDAEDHARHANGGGVQAAPRARAGGGGAPYALRMERMLRSLGSSMVEPEGAPTLMVGTGKIRNPSSCGCHRRAGLCGAFNSSIRAARATFGPEAEGKNVKVSASGAKGATSAPRIRTIIIDHSRAGRHRSLALRSRS